MRLAYSVSVRVVRLSMALGLSLLFACDKGIGPGYLDGEGGNDGDGSGVADRDDDGVSAAEDCDDSNENIGGPTPWYKDADSDGYGPDASATLSCTAQAAMVPQGGDCDDANRYVNPGAPEVCNGGIDDDCNSVADDEDANLSDPLFWYPDNDGDDFGDAAAEPVVACLPPEGQWADAGGDCDDVRSAVNPEAEEQCNNGFDDNCDGSLGDCALDEEYDLADSAARVIGVTDGDFAGWSVAGVGDMNGDGNDDVAVGAPYQDRGEFNAGAVYIVHGPVEEEITASAANAAWYGTEEEDWAGWAVTGAGDVNLDGYPDLLVGSPNDNTSGDNAGAAYLVLGPTLGTNLFTNADAILAGQEVADQAGSYVGTAGDVNGDGTADLLIGAPYHDASGADSGAIYVVSGPATGLIQLNSVTAMAKIVGERAGNVAGFAVEGAGDVNGDGVADLLIGAREAGTSSSKRGRAYLMLGPVSGSVSLSTADLIFDGESNEDHAGTAVTGLGDVNADGLADVAIGAPESDRGGSNAGAVYLIHGVARSAEDPSSTLSLADANAILVGEAAGDAAGRSISEVGDMEHDGFDDLLVGAPYNDSRGSTAGSAYLVSGTAVGIVDLGVAANRFRGVYTSGAADQTGTSVAGAGDLNRDSWPDLIIGAPKNGRADDLPGAAYIIHGLGL